MKIIQSSKWVEDHRYFQNFTIIGSGGSGLSFNCDENGVVLNEEARKRFEHARQFGELDGHPLQYLGLEVYTNEYREPAIGLCDVCNAKVVLDEDPCRCKCGAFYNLSGQRLAHPSQWGEETGERFNDDGQYIGGGDDDIEWE